MKQLILTGSGVIHWATMEAREVLRRLIIYSNETHISRRAFKTLRPRYENRVYIMLLILWASKDRKLHVITVNKV